MRNYCKYELHLYDYFDGVKFKLNNEKLNQHIIMVLDELEKVLNKDNTIDSQYLEIKSNFIKKLISMPVSLFENSYASIIAFINLPSNEQKELLTKLDDALNINVLSNNRIAYKKIENGKTVIEYRYEEHIYEVSDIVNFFILFKIRIERYIDSLIIKYLKMNKVDTSITIDEQIIKINQYIRDTEFLDSDINQFVINEYNNWICLLEICFDDFCKKNISEIIIQIKKALENNIIELNKKRENLIRSYHGCLSKKISTYELKQRKI